MSGGIDRSGRPTTIGRPVAGDPQATKQHTAIGRLERAGRLGTGRPEKTGNP